MKGLIFAIAAIALFVTAGCKKDKEAPGIEIQAPQDHMEFHFGGNIHVEAIFTDDVELAKYRVYMGDEAGNPATGFNWEDAGELSNDSYTYTATIPVPGEAEMMYYLHFDVTDEDGKTSSEKRMLHFHAEEM